MIGRTSLTGLHQNETCFLRWGSHPRDYQFAIRLTAPWNTTTKICTVYKKSHLKPLFKVFIL